MAMMHNNFMPQIFAFEMPMHAQGFKEDVTWPHTANVVLDFLHQTYGQCVSPFSTVP